MKFSTVIPVAFVSLALAAPVAEPQDIDFDVYNAIPVADSLSAPVGTENEGVLVQSAAATTVTAAAATGNAAVVSKQKRTEDCTTQPAGNYATVYPDTEEAFLANPAFSAAATSAVAPPGYFLVAGFENLDASVSNPSYLTYVSSQLTAYDPAQCAPLCNAIAGCNSFNIYFERDPALYLDSVTCPNSGSVTRIKCAFYGSAVSIADATNVGQYQDAFHVVIAGSNAYTLTPQPLTNFTGPVSLGNASIIAPPSAGTYMGVQAFLTTQPYDPSVCALACEAMSAYNTRHAAAGVAPRLCVFFDAYILSKNGVHGVFTCTYYTEAYGPAYATNFGQYDREGDHYTISHSYTYTLDAPSLVN